MSTLKLVNRKGDMSEMLGKHLVTDNGCGVPYVNIESDVEFTSARQANRIGLLRSERERFWAKVTTNGPVRRAVLGECWLWTSNTVRGYGQFCVGRDRAGKQQNVYAHRLAYQLTHGRIESPKIKTCHHCDEPLCVRPSHLFLGTQADNLTDARAKGRLDETRPRTTKQLSPADRLEIFQTPASRGIGVALARRYGVTEACISVIRKGRFVRPDAPLERVFERVPHVDVPVVGELHVGRQSAAVDCPSHFKSVVEVRSC